MIAKKERQNGLGVIWTYIDFPRLLQIVKIRVHELMLRDIDSSIDDDKIQFIDPMLSL